MADAFWSTLLVEVDAASLVVVFFLAATSAIGFLASVLFATGAGVAEANVFASCTLGERFPPDC